MEDDLSPCPFCGGEAYRFTIEESDEVVNIGGDVICCQACGASSHVEFGHKENLVSAWNRRSLPAPGWQPIETAPKDGTAILTYSKGCVENEAIIVMWWTSDKAERCGFGWEAYEVSHMLAPDLWMPIPIPPEEQEG